jgi:NADH:ubiquinone reductase (non-electrogenic)
MAALRRLLPAARLASSASLLAPRGAAPGLSSPLLARRTATAAAPAPAPKPVKKKSSRLVRLLIASSSLIAAFYLADLYANDDLYLLYEPFRPRLSPEDQAKKPHVVILGTGWGALSMLRRIHTDQYRVIVFSSLLPFSFFFHFQGLRGGFLCFGSGMEGKSEMERG